MAFYSSIAPYYDLLFPTDTDQIVFIGSIIDSPERADSGIYGTPDGSGGKSGISFLDLGCGTCSLLLAFIERFDRLVGLDMDCALLGLGRTKFAAIKNGEEPSMKRAFPDVQLIEADMTRVMQYLPAEKFSLITCLGNTLPHLSGIAEITEFFRSASMLLAKNGVFIFQTINYDRILSKGLRGLPTIKRDAVSFERAYSLPGLDGRLDFTTVLTDLKIADSGETALRNTVSLYPLTKDEAEAMLFAAGFASVSFYGDFSGAVWDPDSFLTIGVCLL